MVAGQSFDKQGGLALPNVDDDESTLTAWSAGLRRKRRLNRRSPTPFAFSISSDTESLGEREGMEVGVFEGEVDDPAEEDDSKAGDYADDETA